MALRSFGLHDANSCYMVFPGSSKLIIAQNRLDTTRAQSDKMTKTPAFIFLGYI